MWNNQKEIYSIVWVSFMRGKYMDKKYKDCIVVFLDILGFKNTITNSKTEESVKKIFDILTYIEAWNTSDGLNKFIEEKDFRSESFLENKSVNFNEIQQEIQISYFSDSLAISLPYDESNLETRLFLITRTLAYFITKVSSMNFFIRGGISIGKMYHNKNIFFGPAFLEANRLESEVAIYPRVIFSTDLVDVVKQIPYVKESEDGIFHIDWFDFLKQQVNKEFYQKPANLQNMNYIKKLIQENIDSNDDIKIKSKYIWLLSQI